MASSQERVDTHGASSQDDPARTPPSWNCLNRSTRLIDTGWRLPPFVGCFRSTPTVLDPMHGTTTRKGAGPKRRVTSAPCCSPDGPALGGALLAPSLISQVPLSEYVSADRLG